MENNEKLSLKVDIYYSNMDIDSLRWISDVKNEINKYKTSIEYNFHELSSRYAKNRNITTELITLNGKKITLLQLREVIKSQFIPVQKN